MSELKPFVRLEFMTVKPYFTVKNLLIMAAPALLLTAMSGTALTGAIAGMMNGTLLVSYPFSVSEKYSLDALYVTLSVGRRTVVLGRYVSVLALDALSVVASYAVSSIALFLMRLAGEAAGGADGALALLALAVAALMLLVQLTQLPMLFRLGYAKSRFISVVAPVALMSGFASFLSSGSDDPDRLLWLKSVIEAATGSGSAVVMFAVSAIMLAVYASYRTSLAFYCKREF